MALPVYEVEPIEVDTADGSYTMLQATCPRKGCRGEFWVTYKWAYLAEVVGGSGQVTIITGRSCPYCYKAAEIPAEYARRRRLVRPKKKSNRKV